MELEYRLNYLAETNNKMYSDFLGGNNQILAQLLMKSDYCLCFLLDCVSRK
jgi:hypothetical protein